MKRCEHCNVDVNTTHNTCPLCFRELVDKDDTPCVDLYKTKQPEPVNIRKIILLKIFLFLSIIVVTVSVLINIFTGIIPMWSLIETIGILYCWVLICHTILSDRGIFEKLLLQIGTIVALLFVCEWVSGGSKWMLNYVMPSISILVTFVLFILAQSLKHHKGILSFFVMICVLVVLSGALLIFKVPSYSILHIVAVVEGGLGVVGILIFNAKTLKSEFSKIFHV